MTDSFNEWLRNGYCPKPEKNDSGGFLLPTKAFVDKRGFIWRLFRWIGKRTKSKYIYSKGIREINPQQELLNLLKEKTQAFRF